MIRSHGVPQEVLDRIQALGLDYADATCPFVSKIHKLAADAALEGRTVLIAGNARHPEVKGIMGHCGSECYPFLDAAELESLFQKHPELTKKPLSVVAQTTFQLSEWKICLEIIKRYVQMPAIFDTICNATAQRQSEAARLSEKSDAMIVVGGRQSSNTAKLKDVCMGSCPTYLVETADELPLDKLRKAKFIGITAGASTPASIIKEVLVTMTEIKEGVDMSMESTDSNFEEMLEESLKV